MANLHVFQGYINYFVVMCVLTRINAFKQNVKIPFYVKFLLLTVIFNVCKTAYVRHYNFIILINPIYNHGT